MKRKFVINTLRIVIAAVLVILVLIPSVSAVEIGNYAGSTGSVGYTVMTAAKDREDPLSYSGKYGYNYLGGQSNGTALQAFYRRLETVALAFHNDCSKNVGTDNIVGRAKYSDLGLTVDDISAVWRMFKIDNPIFYWIHTSFMYSGSELLLIADESYSSGSYRKACNDAIFNAVKGITLPDDSVYSAVLYLHDYIIDNMKYSFQNDGVTPSVDYWTQTVVGFFKYGDGVCASYAKAYQLLLNYFGIENIYVRGSAKGVGHAWNLVKMDDGNWYWFDVTWDDAPEFSFGKRYDYFCIGDRSVDGNNDFVQTHIPEAPGKKGVDFFYSLPERSKVKYHNAKYLPIGTKVSTGEYTFTVIGLNTVELNGIKGTGDVVIPEKIRYNGVDYTVISLDNVENSTVEYILDSGARSVFIPASVQYIRNTAIYRGTVEQIIVDKNNTKYCSDQGVLYSKDMKCLISVPAATKGTVVLPSQLEVIGGYAFYACWDVNEVVLPEKLTEIESGAFLYCESLKTVINCSALKPVKGSSALGGVAQSADIIKAHGFSAKLMCDSSAHWQKCIYCLKEGVHEEHRYKDGKCTDCGFKAAVGEIRGDLNDDGSITSEDAVYLLTHLMIPDIYPTDQDCDFDRNGVIDIDDAIYLLFYSMIPEMYPIS